MGNCCLFFGSFFVLRPRPGRRRLLQSAVLPRRLVQSPPRRRHGAARRDSSTVPRETLFVGEPFLCAAEIGEAVGPRCQDRQCYSAPPPNLRGGPGGTAVAAKVRRDEPLVGTSFPLRPAPAPRSRAACCRRRAPPAPKPRAVCCRRRSHLRCDLPQARRAQHVRRSGSHDCCSLPFLVPPRRCRRRRGALYRRRASPGPAAAGVRECAPLRARGPPLGARRPPRRPRRDRRRLPANQNSSAGPVVPPLPWSRARCLQRAGRRPIYFTASRPFWPGPAAARSATPAQPFTQRPQRHLFLAQRCSFVASAAPPPDLGK